MKLLEFKELLKSKSLNRITLPENSELKFRLQTALMHVASEATAKRLIVQEEPIDAIRTFYNPIDDVITYMRKPVATDNDSAEVDIDEELLDAVALYIMAGLERAQAGSHMSLYNKEIALYEDRLSEKSFGDYTQDESKFTQFDTSSKYETFGFPL